MTPTTLAKQLISIPSTSGNEDAIMKFVKSWGKEHHISQTIQEKKGLTNIFLSSGKGPRTIILTTHLDTVVPEPQGWKETKPFDPHEHDGYLFGLGANDAKGIGASMLHTLLAFSKSELAKEYRMIVALVSHEETSGAGTEALVPYLTEKIKPILEETLVIVGEPTGLRHFSIGNKGNAFITVTITGKSAHASRSHQGKNAAVKLAAIISDISSLEKTLNKKYPEHAFNTHTITLTTLESNLGIIDSNIVPAKPNSLPATATATFDCRVGPILFANQFYLLNDELKRFLLEHKESGFKISHNYLHPPVPGHALHDDDPVLDIFKRGVKKMLNKAPQSFATPGANDAPFWGNAGFKTINEYGPGNPKYSHVADERINITELNKAPEVYFSIAKEWFK